MKRDSFKSKASDEFRIAARSGEMSKRSEESLRVEARAGMFREHLDVDHYCKTRGRLDERENVCI
jgi:hypothetical protein